MDQSLEDLLNIETRFNRILLKEMMTCGLGMETAAFYLPISPAGCILLRYLSGKVTGDLSWRVLPKAQLHKE